MELCCEDGMRWTTQAEKFKAEYESHSAQWRQHGRYLKTKYSGGGDKPTIAEAELETTSGDNVPAISVGQLGSFIDTFASNCAAEYELDDRFFDEVVVSFKAAFQRPDTGAPSFSKADFHKIIDALGRKLASSLPKESLVKATHGSSA